MAIIVRMPKMGLTMTEGKITKWFKKEGEEIKKGEVFFEVTTDKITNEVASEVSGIVLKIFVNEDDSAPIKEPVAIVGKLGEDITHLLDSTKILDKVEGKKHKAINESKEETTDRFIKATPWARKLAKERGIELSKIVPTGPNGRVVGNDIDKYYELSGGTKTSPMALKTAENLGVDISKIKTTGRVMKKDVISFYENSKIEELANPHDERIPMTQMRKVISERMSSSWNTSPAVTYEARVDVTKLKELKKDLKPFF